MKAITKNKLREAYKYCNENDKSTEYMFQYMQDFAGVDLQCVLNFLQDNKDSHVEERDEYYSRNDHRL